MNAPPILLKPITTDALADLQAMYEASLDYFITFTGEPVPPIQAANDYHQLLESEDRAILGIWWEQEALIGSLDCRFHHPEDDVLWIGAFILRDQLPAEREDIGLWAIKIFEEWLRIATDIQEIRTAAPLKAASYVRFWRTAGYVLTPELLRLPVAEKFLRFGIFRKFLRRSE